MRLKKLRVRDVLCHVEGLDKAYGDQILFLDLSLQLRRGERLVAVGPSGCGKTTLLRLLALAEAADTGRVDWLAGLRHPPTTQREGGPAPTEVDDARQLATSRCGSARPSGGGAPT
jgi:ATPase subunit of ABC transporter with duplicated ATPase domains